MKTKRAIAAAIATNKPPAADAVLDELFDSYKKSERECDRLRRWLIWFGEVSGERHAVALAREVIEARHQWPPRRGSNG